MFAHFPNPYKDELLYSVLARCQDLLGYPSASAFFRDIFGVEHVAPAIEFPNRLNDLVSKLPPTEANNVNMIIQKHTMLPFYAPFLPKLSFDLILENIKTDGIRRMQTRAGVAGGHIRPPEFLRTCPVCDRENLVQYGETYWKRLHQIRGVEVCPTHLVFLESTDARRERLGIRNKFFAAQSAQRVTVPRSIDLSDPGNRLLLKIAKSAAWLLDKTVSCPGLPAL